MRGACVSWCALFTQRQPPEQGERRCVARALSLSQLFLSFSFFRTRALLPFAPFSLSSSFPSDISVDKPPMHCETPRAIPTNRGTA